MGQKPPRNYAVHMRALPGQLPARVIECAPYEPAPWAAVTDDVDKVTCQRCLSRLAARAKRRPN